MSDVIQSAAEQSKIDYEAAIKHKEMLRNLIEVHKAQVALAQATEKLVKDAIEENTALIKKAQKSTRYAASLAGINLDD